MKFENIKEAKKELIKAILLEHKGLITDNDKLQEKSIKRAFKINTYIKENFDLKEMKDLLDHDKPEVQIWVANLLLPVYEDIAVQILEYVSKKSIPFCSYNAKMMLYGWRNNM